MAKLRALNGYITPLTRQLSAWSFENNESTNLAFDTKTRAFSLSDFARMSNSAVFKVADGLGCEQFVQAMAIRLMSGLLRLNV